MAFSSARNPFDVPGRNFILWGDKVSPSDPPPQLRYQEAHFLLEGSLQASSGPAQRSGSAESDSSVVPRVGMTGVTTSGSDAPVVNTGAAGEVDPGITSPNVVATPPAKTSERTALTRSTFSHRLIREAVDVCNHRVTDLFAVFSTGGRGTG